MKIALIGYGKMGREVEQVALDQGHEVVARVRSTGGEGTASEITENTLGGAQVCIEFSQPSAAPAKPPMPGGIGETPGRGHHGMVSRPPVGKAGGGRKKRRLASTPQTFPWASISFFLSLKGQPGFFIPSKATMSWPWKLTTAKRSTAPAEQPVE